MYVRMVPLPTNRGTVYINPQNVVAVERASDDSCRIQFVGASVALDVLLPQHKVVGELAGSEAPKGG